MSVDVATGQLFDFNVRFPATGMGMLVNRPTRSEWLPLLHALTAHLEASQQVEQRERFKNESFQSMVSNQSDYLSGLFVVRMQENGSPVAVQWSHRLPGASAVVGVPMSVAVDRGVLQVNPECSPAFGRALLQHTCRWLDESGVVLTQRVLESDDPPPGPEWGDLGFDPLVELVYVLKQVPAEFSEKENRPLPFRVESQAGEIDVGAWCAVLERTYQESRDCPELNGRRSTHDALLGYRGTATWLPEGWWIIKSASTGDAAGCVILADHPDAGILELVYVGLAPEFRRSGWGGKLLEQIGQFSQRQQRSQIIAAVDSRNLPALKLYRQNGFQAIAGRRVWARFCG